MMEPKHELKLNVNWGTSMDPRRHVRVPIVLGAYHGDAAGTIITPKLKPGSPRSGFFVTDWIKNQDKRRAGVNKVTMTEDSRAQGNLFLQAAYEAEGWTEGWAAYEAWLAETEPVRTAKGKRRGRAAGKVFPDHLLPKSVLALRAAAKKTALTTTWSQPGLRHPSDADTKADAAKPTAKKSN